MAETVGEVISMAKVQGVIIPPAYKEDYLRLFDSFPDDTVTSLYRDLKDGKKVEDTETEMILGRMVDLGKKAGLSVPCFEKAYAMAQSIGKRNWGGHGMKHT